MCDTIIMPNGKEFESIDGNNACLCGNTQTEILTWIVERVPGVEIGDKLEIEHTPVGYYVSIQKYIYNDDCEEVK